MHNSKPKPFHTGYFLLLFSLINTGFFYILGLQYLKISLSSSTLFATTFYFYHSFFAKSLVILFIVMTYLGQFALLAFLPCLILFPVFAIFRNKWLTLTISIIVWSLLSILLLTDSIVFSLFHFHLNSTLLKVLADQDFQILQLLELSPLEIKIAIIAILIIFSFETISAYFILKKSLLEKWGRIAKRTSVFLFGCLIFSYIAFIITIAQNNNILAQQTPNFPLYNQTLSFLLPLENGVTTINRFSETRYAQPLFPDAPIRYPLHPLQCKKQDNPYNILIIAIDTWRFDAFNPELTPHIYNFARQAWIFNHHMSGGNSTQAGLFSLFYSLPSNYWSAMMKHNQGALLINEAINNRYDVRILFSSEMIPPFNKTIFREVNPIRTKNAGGKTIPDNDRAITQEFKQILDQRDTSRPFFSFLLYDAAHNYYAMQNIPSAYPVNAKDGQRLLLIKNQHDSNELFNRYRNAIHFIDDEVNKILETLKEKKLLDKTIVIITSDHGEEFNDHKLNFWGHGSNYTPVQIQVPLIILWPGQKPKTWSHLTSHYDITPFLMSHVLGCENPFSDYSIGENLLTHHQSSFLLVGSYVNMSIVEPAKSTTLLTSGSIAVADNNANVLPHEKVNTTILKQALWLMRKYFQQ